MPSVVNTVKPLSPNVILPMSVKVNVAGVEFVARLTTICVSSAVAVRASDVRHIEINAFFILLVTWF